MSIVDEGLIPQSRSRKIMEKGTQRLKTLIREKTLEIEREHRIQHLLFIILFLL